MRPMTSLWRQAVTQPERLVSRHGALNTRHILSALCFVLLSPLITVQSPLICYGQTETASISGRITDPKGGVIPKAVVEAIQEDTNVKQTTETNGDGLYYFSSLRPAGYRIVVSRNGFKQVIQSGIVLHTQDSVTLNFSLQLGSVSETVTVSANAEHMPTDNPAVGVLVNRDFIENMPLNGRSLQDLLDLAPGAVDADGYYTVNGQRSDANYYTVDGVAANTNPNIQGVLATGVLSGVAGAYPNQTALGTTQGLASVDNLQEFKIQTSDYSAEFGRQPGGQVGLTTRSGTNDLHGSLFDYFRNTVLDANNWFNNLDAIAREPERQNDFGGTFGGPLVIPTIYNGKNKTFFFISYEGLRLVQPQATATFNVPSVAFRQFAAPSVQPFLNAMPLPQPSAVGNGDQCALSLGYTFSCSDPFVSAVSSPSSLNALNVRVDQGIGQRVQLFAHYAYTPSFQKSTVLSQLDETSVNSWILTAGATARINASLTDEFRFNYTLNWGAGTSNPAAIAGAVPYARDLIVPDQYAAGISVEAAAGVYLPDSSISNNYPGYSSTDIKTRQFNLVDDVDWTHGRHTLKVGADFRRLMPSYNPVQDDTAFDILSIEGVEQGFSDLVIRAAATPARPVFLNLSLYIQDHWKLTDRLTLDYGLRWEFNPAPGASDGVFPLALTTGDLSSAQLAPRGTPQYRSVYHNFAPRLGFAYNVIPSPRHPMVVRGGFGIFYDTGQQLGVQGYSGYPFSAFAPFLLDVALPPNPALLAPPSLSLPLTPPYGTLQGVNVPDLQLPYTESWNLSIAQGLNERDTVTVSYVGNAGKKLLYTQLFISPTPEFSNVYLTNNGSSSSYEGLQIQNQGYLAPGLQAIVAYTFAHSIDNASNDDTVFAPLRGNSDYDIRQNLNAAINYEIPEANRNWLIRALTHGWNLDSRVTVRSGLPIDVTQGAYVSPTGQLIYIRPDIVQGVPIVLHTNSPSVLGGWELNSAAFGPVPTDPNTGAPLEQGNLGRNFIHGPNFWSLNTAVQRNFQLREDLRLAFRLDAFNLFNHANAGNIDSNLADGPGLFGISNSVPTIGVPNSLYAAGSPRSLQLMLKLQF
jgi:hypothetical protein